jgi:type IV pilus assembly protein PilO
MAWYNPTDPAQRNWALGGLAVLVLIVPFNMYFLTPRNDQNDVVRDRLESLEIRNRQATAIIARGGVDELRRRMEQYSRHVARLEELIPGQEEVASLLNDIQGRARNTNIDVQGLDPEPPQPAGPYTRTTYQMTVVGEYHDVARFLTEIASLSRIVTPVQVELELFGQPQTRRDMEYPVRATFRIETYVLPDQSALPPAELPGDRP